MSATSAKWGIVSTIKAAPEDVLAFAAYHLEQGAHRLYLYLDDANDALAAILRRKPEIKVVTCDETWWAKRKGRPDKHQSRQFINARHAYNRRVEVDWLAHIDVDEFIAPPRPMGDILGAVPQDALCARIRPVEALAGADGLFKSFHRDHKARSRAARALYPTYGSYLQGGFLSHVAGKLFYRTGVAGLRAKIHNIAVDGAQNPGEVALDQVDLCHVHARSWEEWSAHFRYRHAQGSYRAELKGRGTLTPHQLFSQILETEGDAGLRHFFDEVCAATPEHVAALECENLLRRHDLNLTEVRTKHFPVH
ncbi:glycosyltransferase family 2 protein [Roseobacteraceae bacterium S113]